MWESEMIVISSALLHGLWITFSLIKCLLLRNCISEGEQQNLDAIAREKIVKFVLSLMGEYFKIVEDRLELEVNTIMPNFENTTVLE